MAGHKGSALSSKVDWKDIGERLNDPKQRRTIVTKTDTEELNRLKTKNAFVKRKRKLLDQILKITNFYNPISITKPVEKFDHSDSRCSELNFSNDEVPSTPPPTLNHNPTLGPLTHTATGGPANPPKTNAAQPSSDSEVDMGDYEHRIRPSSAFWRKADGLSLAEKIIYYRTWKYRNIPRQGPNTQPMDDEIETTLMEYRRGTRSTRRPAKSAVITRNRPTEDDDDDDALGRPPRRPGTVIPKITKQRHDAVMFPLIDTRSHVIANSSRDVNKSDADDRLPSIERNQFVSRKSPNKEEEEEEENEMQDYDVTKKEEEEEEMAETEIDSVMKEKEDEHAGKDPDKNEDINDEKKKDDDDDNGRNNEDEKENDETPIEEEDKKKRRNGVGGRGPKAPRPNTQPDRLIKKLDKKVERDLRGLQGQNNDDNDDDDDDDSDVDEETMNDLLFGERGKELDQFLKS